MLHILRCKRPSRTHFLDLRLCCRVACKYLASCCALSLPTVADKSRSTSSCTCESATQFPHAACPTRTRLQAHVEILLGHMTEEKKQCYLSS